MADWAQIANLVITIVNVALTFSLHIQHNKFKSSCCKGKLCNMEDELEMQPTPTTPPLPIITITEPK